MKRLMFAIVVISVSSLSFFLFTGCSTDPAYYIKFTIDDQEFTYVIELNCAEADIEQNYPAVAASPSKDSLFFGGTSCDSCDIRSPGFELDGYLNPDSAGDYLGTYSQTGSDAGVSAITLWIFEDCDPFVYSQLEGTITGE
jgi:hypothetical protein